MIWPSERGRSFAYWDWLCSWVIYKIKSNSYQINLFPSWQLFLQILETAIGLFLIWDGVYKVQVYLPETFSNTVCGLCGDMDGTPDEYILQDGGTVRNKT